MGSSSVLLLIVQTNKDVILCYWIEQKHHDDVKKKKKKIELHHSCECLLVYLFPMCLLATESDAMADTVSASSASRCRASLSEQPSVEAERWRERQYLPAGEAGQRSGRAL